MKVTRTLENCPVTMKLVADAIDPIVEWVEAERGRKTEFVSEVQRTLFPESASRNQIESWIHKDAERRVVPGFGYGLAVMATAERLGIYKKPKPEPEPQVS